MYLYIKFKLGIVTMYILIQNYLHIYIVALYANSKSFCMTKVITRLPYDHRFRMLQRKKGIASFSVDLDTWGEGGA